MRRTGDEIFQANLHAARGKSDRLFGWLLAAQWAFAIGVALAISPFSYDGTERSIHLHVILAVVVGGVLNALPWYLIRTRPGWWGTRHAVAVAQMLWSALLIHLTGGRIETHFHVFGSLAFLAFYRDWRVLATATVVVASDHLARGLVSPSSVYGILNPEWWRFIEHATWVVFEDVILVLGCLRGISEMRLLADREAALEVVNSEIERRVVERTTELSVANAKLGREMKSRLQAEAELRQAQKLESVGRMASGVAHEINTPIQFVSDSIYFLRDATNDLIGIVNKLQIVQHGAMAGNVSKEALADVREAEQAADLPYLFERVPKAFERSLDGLGRVASIVRSMKVFAHPDSTEMASVDLNTAIESTLVIAHNEYKYIADVETELGNLPHVTCFAGDVNQAILNIIINAAHAVGDVVKGTEAKGKITVRTRHVTTDNHVEIAIGDSGTGIPEAIRDRIFDPFFTTKEVGRGTGQGLAIVHAIIVDRHGGQVSVESKVGQGTTFVLRIPVDGRSATMRRRAA